MTTDKPDKWLVMIYMAGNNSLGEDCVAALTQMAEANISDNIAVFAQLNTDVHKATTLQITNATTVDGIHDQLNKAIAAQAWSGEREEEREASHKQKIFTFVESCLEKFRADHFMLVLSGHGAGVEPFLIENTGANSFTVINLGELIE